MMQQQPREVVRRGVRNRRGVTAMLAMLYLMLFSTLALGFFASVTLSVQIASNDQRVAQARVAAESGMQFMKYHLASMDIPKTTLESEMISATFTALRTRLDGTSNMMGHTVALSADGTQVLIPGTPNAYIRVDPNGLEFRATIERQGEYGLRVKTVGRSNGVTGSARGIRLDYSNRLRPGSLFAYGVASKSAINVAGSVRVVGPATNLGLASLLSTSTALNPITVMDSAVVSGDITTIGGVPVVGPLAKVGNVSPTDLSFSSHVHQIAPDDAPEFPVVDTSAFLQYVPAKGSVGPGVLATATPPAGTYRNLRIPAGLNPTFSGAGLVLEGVVVIEHPNQVKFVSAVTIKGVIVSECDANDNNNQALVDADMVSNGVMDNWVHFGGSVSCAGVETLDPAVFPASLRARTGSLLLIPGFQANFRGGADNLGGAIVASGMDWAGNTGGTLNASIINVAPNAPMRMSGNQTLTINGHGTGNSAGLRFESHFAPLPDTYLEVKP